MNLQKRVKRHIWSQELRFLVTQPPALRPICNEEMRLLGLPSVDQTDQGLYFSGKIEEAYRAHLYLRTASRLWLSLPDFKAGAQEELFRKTSRLPWELLISPNIPLDVSARVRRSRLEHEGQTAVTVQKAIRHHFVEEGLKAPREADGPEKGLRQRIHISAENDRVELRIDLSGDHLHRRSYRKSSVEAPLRETLAAALVLWGLENWRSAHPGRQWPERVHDPFCGSGTLPIEASLIASNSAPGAGREFLFMLQPHYRQAAFEYLKRTAAEGVTKAHFSVSASDLDPAAVEAARLNAAAAGADVRFAAEDAFAGAAGSHLGPGTLVISNPPYGQRLEGGVELFRRLIPLLRESGSRAVLLLPSAAEKSIELPADTPRLKLDNGGIPVQALFI